MHSSFLTVVNLCLALYSTVLFLKLVVQFGLPNHPARFTSYVISLCVAAFFVLETSTAFALIGPMEWMKWRPFFLVCGSIGLLFQAITASGSFSLIQQKVFSRMPLIAGLVCFAFFPTKADVFMLVSILASLGFLSVSVGKARYQKRAFFKMSFFLGLTALSRLFDHYWVYNVGQIFLAFSVFYFFLFEHTFGIAALIEDIDRFEKKASP